MFLTGSARAQIQEGDTLLLEFRDYTKRLRLYHADGDKFREHGYLNYEARGDTLFIGRAVSNLMHEAIWRDSTIIIGALSAQWVGATMGKLRKAQRHTKARQPNVVAEFSGSGIASTRPFSVDGPWSVEWDTDSPMIGVFAWEAGDPDSVYPGIIAMQNNSGPGSAYIDKGGRYYFKITCPGAWSLRVVRED
jgi:hypothetical protein